MLRRLAFGVILLFLLVTFGVVTQSEAVTAWESAPQELHFLDWSNYIEPDVVRKFEIRFNVKVYEINFGSDDVCSGILLSAEGKNFDVAVIDGVSMQAYIRQAGWLLLPKN